MNIGTIKSHVAALLRKDVSYFVQNGVDLLLAALNDARRDAEKLHDFAHNHALWELSVSPTSGGSLSDATLVDPESWMTGCLIKSIETFYLLSEDGLTVTPLYHYTKKNVAVWTKERNYRTRRFDGGSRYPSDRGLPSTQPSLGVMLNGRKVEMHPTQDTDVTLRIEGQIWMPSYTANGDTDWMTEYGSDYLKYAAVVACNLFTQTFVASAESLGPPTKQAESALANLVAWDADWMMNGRQPLATRG